MFPVDNFFNNKIHHAQFLYMLNIPYTKQSILANS